MGYREKARQILAPFGSDGISAKDFVTAVAKGLYEEYKTGTEEGWDSGYDDGYQTATNNLSAAGHKTNVFGLNGQYLRYTDPRGLTFYAGGLVFLEGLMATAMVERIFEDKLLLSNYGALQEFSIDACRPIGGYTTPDNFLPLGAVVVRRLDGQLGLVGQTYAGDRFIGYGGTDTHIETSLEGWHETIIRPGTWVRAQTGAWYKVEAVDTNNHRLTLDDRGPRYFRQRLYDDDTIPISTCHVNVCTPHYIGERVVHIATGREGTITDNLADGHSYGYWYVSFTDAGHCHPVSSHEIATVPYYYGQKVLYNNRVYTVQAVAGQVIDGRLTTTDLRIDWDGTWANVHANKVKTLVEIETYSGFGSILVNPSNVKAVNEIMSDYSHLLTPKGQHQLLSIARAFLRPQQKEKLMAAANTRRITDIRQFNPSPGE